MSRLEEQLRALEKICVEKIKNNSFYSRIDHFNSFRQGTIRTCEDILSYIRPILEEHFDD